MRVYELIGKALEFAGGASPFDAGENTAGILALKHLSKIKRVVVAAKSVIMYEFGAAMFFAWVFCHA